MVSVYNIYSPYYNYYFMVNISEANVISIDSSVSSQSPFGPDYSCSNCQCYGFPCANCKMYIFDGQQLPIPEPSQLKKSYSQIIQGKDWGDISDDDE
jgi:hypothetical protein